MAALLLSWLADARAQEAPRPSMARMRSQQAMPTDYNLKAGSLLLNFDTSLGIEFIDNIRLTNPSVAPSESDLLFTPQFGIDIAWPVTKLNGLRFNTRIGYSKFLDHSDLDSSSLILAPDSALSFDFFVRDVKVNLHDRFSLQNDPVSTGQLSGVPRFGQFTNVAGVSLLWDLKDLLVSTGYDYITMTTTGTKNATDAGYNVASYDRASHQFSLSVTALLRDSVYGGIESTFTDTTYLNSPLYDSTRLSVGPFISAQLSRYTKVYLAGGFQNISYANADSLKSVPGRNPDFAAGANPFLKNTNPGAANSGTGLSSDGNSYYGSLIISHRLNRYYSEELSIGHEELLDISGLRSITDYVRYSSNLQINAYLSLGTSLFYEDVGLSKLSNQSPYSRFGASLSTGYRITKHLNLSLSYQFVKKTAQNPAEDYTQNRLGVNFRYDF